MKKHFLSFLFSLSALLVWADHIPVELARQMADDFFRANSRYVYGLSLVNDDVTAQTRSGGAEPAYYVFNNEGGDGFVVMAADDLAARPILGYSLSGQFPTHRRLSPAVSGWLRSMQREIDHLRSHPSQAFPRRQAATRAAITRAGNAVVELETAKWDQASPYWNLLDYLPGHKLLVGCTSTAAAIMMHYHRWPVRGMGKLPGYTTATNKYQVPDVALGHDYQWDKMLTVYGDSYSSDEANAVATLMRDVSVGLQADYGMYETGAYTQNIPSFLIDHMDYDKSVVCLDRNSFGADEWAERMKQELRESRPVVYSGFGSNPATMGGHAFVLDGYDDNGYFRINFGWSGYCDGYYLLTNIYPEEQGSGGTGFDFNHYQGAVVGARKNAGSESVTMIRYLGEHYAYGSVDYFGIQTDTDRFEKSTPFTLWAGCLMNLGNEKFNGDFRLVLLDAHGTLKQRFEELNCRGDNALGVRHLAFFQPARYTLDEELAGGDHIVVQYRTEGSDDGWQTVKGSDEVPWKLVLLDTEVTSLAAYTQVSYRKASGQLLVSTLSGATLAVSAPDGTDASDVVEQTAGGKFTINTASLPAGTSVLTIAHGTQTKSFKFTK